MKDDIINRINQLFQSGKLSYEEKKILLRLKKIYMQIFKDKELEEVYALENKLYNNRNPKEKFMFEKYRILDEIKPIDENQAFNVLYFLDLLKKREKKFLDNSHNDDKVYSYLLNELVGLELEYGISIGLYQEFEHYLGKYLEELEYKMEYKKGDDLVAKFHK